jgi:hypothetical protein
MKAIKKLLSVILLSGAGFLGAQNNPEPCPLVNSNYHPLVSQSSYCQIFTDDFIPDTTDGILTVNLNMFVINKDDGTGDWSYTTKQNLINVVARLNNIYGDIQPAWRPKPGAGYRHDTRIRFRIKDTVFFNNTYYYDSLCFYNHPAYASSLISDCNAITVVYTRFTPGCIGSNTANYPGRLVFMNGGGLTPWGSPTVPDLDNETLALAHELGHAMGLGHTTNTQPETYAKSVLGPSFCCDYLHADDVEYEDSYVYLQLKMDCQNFIPGVTSPAPSNNIMGNNEKCRGYFSPRQMAIMHYNLRTELRNVLTQQGFTNAVTVDHNHDLHINASTGGSQTWMWNRYLKGDLIIDSAFGLTINCDIAMTAGARIIVKPGAQLVVNATIRNISGVLWEGIQVGGHKNKNQLYNPSTGQSPWQGVLRVEQHGVISNAANGIKNYMTDQNFVPDYNSAGGIILANHANFINNTRDVEFYPYNYAYSISSFYNCNFKTTGEIGKTSGGWYADPLCRVTLWDIEGVTFRNCTFEYAAGNMYTNHGNGIGSYNASYSVDRTPGDSTCFIKMYRGIDASGGMPLRLPSIRNTKFYDSQLDAAYFLNLHSLVFRDNYIRTQSSNGVYLDMCKDYSVRNNVFVGGTSMQVGTGIYAFKSIDGSHEIYRNRFSDLAVGIGAIGNNSNPGNFTTGLLMNCNDFSAPENDFDIAMFVDWSSSGAYPTVRYNQGSFTPSGSVDPLKLVRNIYGASSDCSTCENQWYVETTPIRAIKHVANSNSNTRPEPQPDYSDTYVQIVNSGHALNYSSDCPVNPPSSGGSNDPTVTLNPGQILANTGSHLNDLLGVKKEEDRDHFEIQSTISTQLGLFLTDSVLHNADSVIALLESDRGSFIPDADILTIYAYIHKGDLNTAQIKMNALPSSRSEWKTLLGRQIYFEEYPAGISNLSPDDISLLEGYTTDAIDGSAAAKAMLKAFNTRNFSEQRPLPTDVDGRRLSGSTETEGVTSVTALDPAKMEVYPNPASESLFIAYTATNDKTLRYELRDALGRLALEGRIKSGERMALPLTGLSYGVYLFSAYDQKTQVYQTKVVCIK